ncbi:MAG: nitroreductase family protein [Actinomycetota bacterium]|nr:nitroreductase family protein [Actinomycetota bacterium]
MNDVPSAVGLPADKTRRLLASAGLAPSVHNTQPWRFRLTPSAIELHTDPARQLRVADPDGTELRLSCGAALFNLRMALGQLGVRPVVSILADRDDPGLIARVHAGAAKAPSPEESGLALAIPQRHTNRRPFSDTPVDSAQLHDLLMAAQHEQAWLHPVQERVQRDELGQLAARAHRLQLADPAFRAELGAWSGGSAAARHDGVPVRAGGPAPGPRDVWMLRDFTADRRPGHSESPGFEEEPLVAVLGANADGPTGDVHAGQALQRVLLTATVDGLAVSLISQLIEVVEIREQVRQLLGHARLPLAVLRIGHGWPVTATPRRTVEDLVMADQGT